MRSSAQVLMSLMDKLMTLLTAMVNLADQDQHDAEVAQLREEITQAKEDLAAEDVRITAEWATLDARAQQIQAQAFQLALDQNTSNEVMRRRHQSRLPRICEPRNLFCTPGARPSNLPEVNRTAAPGAGTPGQPRVMEPPCPNTAPPQHVPVPPGHYSNPLENIIAAATRLVALPFDGDSPTALETQRVRELL